MENSFTMAKKYSEKMLSSISHQEMWLKITVKYHFTSARMAAIFKIGK